jgi:hypothetical protein
MQNTTQRVGKYNQMNNKRMETSHNAQGKKKPQNFGNPIKFIQRK